MAKNNWEETTINLGKVKEHSKKIVTFKMVEGFEDVSHVTASCGCTTADFKDGILTASINVGRISPHLKDRKEVEIEKYIRVFYNDKSVDRLTIKGTLIR